MRNLIWLLTLVAFGGGVALIPSTSAQPAVRQWESITSKEGRFSVEMPAKPDIQRTRTRRTAGGTVKSTIIGCKTAAGGYLVYRIDLPTAIVKGTEEAELRDARDDIAKEWNGKVLAEKRVKAGLRIGLDFTIRGKLAEETGVSTIRTRMYLDGKTIFATLVVSAPNRELPEDAGRFLGSLAIGNDKAKAAGGLEPDPVGKNLPGWGLAIDPDSDCKIDPDGTKSLSIAIPGIWHDLNPHVNKLNAPRVIQTVEGDFTVTVKVVGDFKPAGKSLNPTSIPANGGGIVVWNNSDNFIRLERFAVLRKGRVNPFIAFVEREGGYEGAVHNVGYPGGDCYLRMERRGSRIAGYTSTNGTQWKQLKPIDTLWPSRLKVGLSACNCTTEPTSVKFEKFTLTGKVVEGTPPAGRKVD